jgi:hypothetical protein
MNCGAVRERLVAFQDHELMPGEHVLVGEHLARCEACHDLERRLADATPRPFATLPAATRQRLWRELDRALDAASHLPPTVPPGPARWSCALRPVELPAAAVVAYGLMLGLALGWGLHGWQSSRALEADIARRDVQVATTVVPRDQYRTTAWVPAAEGATTATAAP